MVSNSEKSLMRTGLFSSRTKMISYLLLRFIADKDEPAGSWVLREDLLSFGIDCSTATIGRYLKELDYREYTVQKSNQGRVLTPIGQAHLEELEERLERTRMQEKLSKAMKVTEYPDILSLEDVRSILNVRTKKTAARWLQNKGIFYFRVGREYRIPKVHLVNYFMGLSSM